MHRYQDPSNPINGLDINCDGTKFATGGFDTEVKVYDLGKRTPPTILEGFEGGAPKHSNRVYGIKFYKDNPNLLISSGWDQLILFWDLRVKHTTGYLFGAKIYGDSMDIKNNVLLTGSWREKH